MADEIHRKEAEEAEDSAQQAERAETAALPIAAELEQRRMVEAILFASETPLSIDDIGERVPEGVDIVAHLEALQEDYRNRGVNLVKLAGKHMFRTADDLSFLLRREVDEPRKLSRAAVETLSIIAYHQPVTRTEIEEVRGVTISKGTLDVLMEAGWVRMLGRKRTPGRPVTYGTTEEFLVHFGIESIKDLPGLQELKAAGLLDSVDVALDKLGGMPSAADGDDDDDGQIDLEDAIAEIDKEEEPELGGNEEKHDADNPDVFAENSDELKD